VITKIQAAEQQLDTAIRLFFENIDHLSAYTLAAASREITDDLCEKKTHELFQQEFARLGDALQVRLSFRDQMRIFIKDEYFKDAMNLFKKRQNFLKHADKDPGMEMDDLTARELAFVILFAGKNFSLLERRLTPALSIFVHWFGAAEPRIVKERSDTHDKFFKLIEALRTTFEDLYSREAFKAMHEILKDYYLPK
jgi:hypothetical protein